MALPDLLRALRAQAAERRAEELAAAAARAESIRSESRAALGRRRGEFVARARREEEDAAHRALSQAHAEAVGSTLGARERLLTRVREALGARVAAAEGDAAYLASLSRELRESLDRLPPGPVVVRSRPALVEPITLALGGVDGVIVESSAELGVGFTASVLGEGVEVDGTLATRLHHAWPRLAVSVLRDAST